MKNKKMLLLSLIFLIATISLAAIVPSKIVVNGNEILKAREILEALQIKPGDSIVEESLAASLTKVGYFKDAGFYFDEVSETLLIEVIEFNRVNLDFEYEGPELVSLATLKEAELSIKNKMPMDPSRLVYEIPRTLDSITEILSEAGYIEPFVDVEWKTDPEIGFITSGNFDGQVNVTFIIKPYYLWNIEIGAPLSNVSAQIIKDQFTIKYMEDYYETPQFYRWLLQKKAYVPTVADIQKAVQTVFTTYFANQLGSWGMTSETYQLMIKTIGETFKSARTVALPEGEDGAAKSITIGFTPSNYLAVPFNLKGIFVEGNTQISTLKIIESLGLKEEQEIKSEDLARALENLKNLYSDEGYPFVKISVLSDSKLGFATFKILEPIVSEVNVNFDGEQKTQDYLIEDKVIIETGKKLSLDTFKKTYAFLNSTGYFESVNLSPIPKQDDTLKIDIDLKENLKTSKVIGGGGWQGGIALNLDMSLLNPAGYGQKLSAKVNLNIPIGKGKTIVETKDDETKTTVKSPAIDLELSYSIPKLMGTAYDLESAVSVEFSTENVTTASATEDGINSTNTTVVMNSEKKNLLISVSPVYNIDPSSKVGLTAGYESLTTDSAVSTTTIVNSGTPNVETGSTSDGFDGVFGSVFYRFSTRDSTTRPTNGSEINSKLFIRGIGGQSKLPFAGLNLEYKTFIPVGEQTLGFRVYTNQLVALNDENRIYSSYLLSPDSLLRVRTETMAGKNFPGITGASLQLRIPVPRTENFPLDVVLFGDMAFYRSDASDPIGTDYIADFGASLNVNVPLLGLLRVGYGYNTYYANTRSPYYGTFFFGMGPLF